MKTLPKEGMSREALTAAMQALRGGDAPWATGKTFSLIYNAGAEVTSVLKEAYDLFGMANALSPMAFPSLRTMETEICRMTASLFHGGEGSCGTLTTGGTESVLMAVKTVRERTKALRPHITAPEMVVPISAHPAFEKAAHYFGVKAVRTPLGPDLKADVAAMRAATNHNTILLVGSAFGFPHGIIDPIEEIGALAEEKELPFHVDGCLGGYILPFVERLGYDIPPFDFRVPGVTSMSADLHKYGYASKGVSTILYRDRELRKHQFFAYTDWPGGIYASPSMAGSRGGGPIASAWAVMRFLGESGYMKLAADAMAATQTIQEAIRCTRGLRILGDPKATVFAFASDGADVYTIGEGLEKRGWCLDRQQLPPSLHMTVSPYHVACAGAFVSDLAAAVAEAEAKGPTEGGVAAMYGMLAALPDRGMAASFAVDFLDALDQ